MGMNWLEIAGVALGVAYLVLEYRVSVWVWAVGIAMPALYLVVYWQAGLYADFAISIYYIIASVYGLIVWMRGNERDRGDECDEGVVRTPRWAWGVAAVSTLVLWVGIGEALWRFTDSTVPWADGFTTALSITAMWMLARKFTGQWLVWLVADLACAWLYYYKGLYFTCGLYAVYAVVAALGYRKWRKLAELNTV